MRRVVRGNAYRNPVADNHPDVEPPHAAAKFCGQLLAVFQLHDERPASARLDDRSFQFRKIIFCHVSTVP